MKKSTHNQSEPPEKQHFKKSYLQRKLEEKEADDEIKAYERSKEMSETPDVDEKGPM